MPYASPVASRIHRQRGFCFYELPPDAWPKYETVFSSKKSPKIGKEDKWVPMSAKDLIFGIRGLKASCHISSFPPPRDVTRWPLAEPKCGWKYGLKIHPINTLTSGLRKGGDVSSVVRVCPPVPWPEPASELHRATAACRRSYCQFLRIEGARGQRNGSQRPYSRFSRPGPLFLLPSSSSIVLMRLNGPSSRPTTYQKIW
jgi:hypothetical protein